MHGSIIKVLIVDDHQIMIDGIKALLKNEKNIEVVGEMLNGMDALLFIKENAVDVVIADISMPQMSGIELTRSIKKEHSPIKVLVLTMHNEGNLIKEIVDAKASGYVLKNTGKKELVEAINKIALGKTFYSNEVLQVMIKNIAENKEDKLPSLTSRELDVIKLIAKEYSNGDIANALFISERTVETHRKNIFRKTNTKGVVALLNYVYKHKII